MSRKLTTLFSLLLLLTANAPVLGAVIFTEPHLVDTPGNGGSIFLGIATDTPGGEFFSYNFTGMNFSSVDADVVVTPVPSSGVFEAPAVPGPSLALLVGTYDVLGTADLLDTTTFDLNITIDPIAANGSSFDPIIDGPVSGSVTAVPEPAAAGLALMGIVMSGYRRRR